MDIVVQFLLRWLYTVSFTVAIPVVLLRLWWKGYHNPGYRYHWQDRLGLFTPPTERGGLWIHAVSVGESMAAVPLIRAFQQQFPNVPITITSTTPTGYARIENLFKDKQGLFHVYFPYDVPGCLKRFFNRIQPDLLVLMETELWPNCLWMCRQRRIPVIVVNGRLSPRSMKGYRRIKPIIKAMLKCVTEVIAQSESDGARFVELGLDPKRLTVTGNIKFDIPLKEGLSVEGIELRVSFGSLRPVFVAASTHAGEEEQILRAFDEIRKHFNDLLLILVPRNPERFKSVADLIQERGYALVLRSHETPVTSETEVLLGDTMGELGLFYAASDVAFVGGSLIPLGGHNILEPAALGVPVIVGPHMHNFLEITEFLKVAGALVQVADPLTLAKKVIEWLASSEAHRQASEAGKKIVEKNRGAIHQIMRSIQKTFKYHPPTLVARATAEPLSSE